MSKILIVEDDKNMTEMVMDWLKFERYVVEAVDNGRDALNLMRSFSYDLVILDWAIPELSGLDVLKQYRAQGGQALILILTGKSEVENKETGLDAGADDYLTKPFQARELSARIRALLRRSASIVQDVLKSGTLELNPKDHSVFKDGKPLSLAPREFSLLEYFMRHPNEVFSPEALLNSVWESDLEASLDTVRVCVNRLRSKLGTDETLPSIRTVFGVGYKLEPPAI